MTALLMLGALLLLAVPVISIVALVMVVGDRDRLRHLQQRVAALEARPAASPIAAAPAEPSPPPAVVVSEPSPAIEEPLPEPAAPATSSPAAAPTSSTLEEKFGTRWVVWIGGLALALGGIFLVRYSIEQGLLGPGMRIFFGTLFAALLITAGEWARRNEVAAGVAAIPSQHIPSILTAAGTIAAYATVYAAYALYGFLSPPLAFILLGLVAVATLAAALLHGPALAGLGVAGAFVTPLLVQTNAPNYWALYVYLAIVTAAAFALARVKLWRWLAVTAVVLGALWTLPGISYPQVDALAAHLFHVIAGFALAATLIVSGLFLVQPPSLVKSTRFLPARSAPICLPQPCSSSAAFTISAALAIFTVLATITVAIACAHRGRTLGAACGRPYGDFGDATVVRAGNIRATGNACRHHPRRHSRFTNRYRIASSARGGIYRSVRVVWLCRARPFRKSDCSTAMERHGRTYADRDPGRALLACCGIRPLDPICWARTRTRGALRLCNRIADQHARRALGLPVRRRYLLPVRWRHWRWR